MIGGYFRKRSLFSLAWAHLLGELPNQELVEFFQVGVVLLDAAVRNHDIALEVGIGDFQQADLAAVHLAPGEFGPEPDAEAARDGVLHDEGVIALENVVRLESDAVAEIAANLVQLLGAVQADKVRVAQLVERYAVALLVLCVVGYGQKDFFGTHEYFFVGVLLRSVFREGLHADVVEGGFFFLHEVKADARSFLFVLDDGVRHER